MGDLECSNQVPRIQVGHITVFEGVLTARNERALTLIRQVVGWLMHLSII